MSTRLRLAAMVAVALVVAGCDGGESAKSATTSAAVISTAPPSSVAATSSSVEDSAWLPPETIDCTTTYQPTTTASEQETNVVSVHRTEALMGDEATLTLGPFTFSVSYSGNTPEGENVLITLRQTADNNGPVSHSYYRTDVPMSVGVYGFSGFQRVEVEGSAVQWWCEGK